MQRALARVDAAAGASVAPPALPQDDMIRAMVERAGYRGHCEVEILSANNWWKRDPDEVLRICIERHQTVV